MRITVFKVTSSCWCEALTILHGVKVADRSKTKVAQVDRQGNPLCILTVHAHPDDEASKGAPTFAKYAESGVRTVLVCCTGGEEGDVNNPALKEPGMPFHGLDPDAQRRLLIEMRPKELDKSVEVIGFSKLHMLGYRDSGMAESEANSNPDCFHMAAVDEATERLVKIIRAEKPQVVVTYSDDQRGYLHPDHLKVHEISVLAFERAGDASWYKNAGPVWQPLKMYYSVWSRVRLRSVHEALLRLRGSSPYDEEWFDRPNLDHRITTKMSVGQYFWARSGALKAHATQVDLNEPFWFGLTDEELAEVYPYEDWILAANHLPNYSPTQVGLESDLFAGI